MKKWEISGLSLELDLENLETAERYDNAFALMNQEEHQILETEFEKHSDFIRAYCNLYRHLFEHLFGKETAGQIFQNLPVNSRVYEEIYIDFLRFAVTSQAQASDERRERFHPFSGNRQQKRQLKKRKKHKK